MGTITNNWRILKKLHFDIYGILRLKNVQNVLHLSDLFFSIFGSFGEVSLAKNLAKIEKPPFLEPQNMKISPAKIQKSVGKKSGQLLSRDRSTQKQISQTTVLLRVVSLVSNLANPF